MRTRQIGFRHDRLGTDGFVVPQHRGVILNEGDEAPSDLWPLVVLKEMAGLRESRMGLAGRPGDVADQVVLHLARSQAAGIIFAAQRVTKGRSKAISPALASAFTPACSLISDGNVRTPAM